MQEALRENICKGEKEDRYVAGREDFQPMTSPVKGDGEGDGESLRLQNTLESLGQWMSLAEDARSRTPTWAGGQHKYLWTEGSMFSL